MKKEEFEKLVRFEELAKTTDENRFMYKAYLDCLLKGGKIREPMFLYALGSNHNPILMGEAKEEGKVLDMKDGKQVSSLVDLFEKTKERGFWVTKDISIAYYDLDGKKIQGEYTEKWPPNLRRVSKIKKITTVNTYYLHKPFDIKPFGNKVVEE